MSSISLEALSEEERQSIKPIVENIKQLIQADVIGTAITSSCVGLSPLEVLEPLTSLMKAIMKFSQWTEIEASVSAAIDCGQFQLGDEAKTVVFEAFKKSTTSEYVDANFGKMISDTWNMHQTDDTGSIAGGEAVLDFVQRYKNS